MKEQWMEIRGLQIFVKQVGTGEPLLFLHGGPGGEHRFFLPHLEELSNDFQLIFYDQPGCGQSPQAIDDLYSLEEEVETLEELRIRLGISKLNLIGESWGSMLTLLYATKYKENVNKIFLTAAVGALGSHLIDFGKELENKLSSEDKVKLADISNLLKNGEAELQDLFRIINPYYVYSIESLNSKTKTESNPIVNRILGQEIINQFDLTDSLSTLMDIPVFVAQGDHDIISPQMLTETLMKYIPHAKLKIIRECGHWSVVEQPDVMMNLIKEFFEGENI
jgi:proline iminopeptidase